MKKSVVNEHNVVIITEDSGSGRDIFNIVRIALKKENYLIESTGGNKNFYSTVVRLGDSHTIHRGTTAFLAVDNIALNPLNSANGSRNKIAQNIAEIRADLGDCKRYISDMKHGAYIESTYQSIEAVLLSYRLWAKITKTYRQYGYTPYTKELQEIYFGLDAETIDKLQGEDDPGFSFYYDMLYSFAKRHHKTIEAVISDMLNAVSKRNCAAHMEINKSSIGSCLYRSCRAAETETGINCSNCAINNEFELQHMKNSHDKVSSLVSNSRFSEIFKVIEETRRQFI